MLGPEITDPKILKEIEVFHKEAAERGGFHDPGLEAFLEEIEQEPGYWERMAEFSEQFWPSKKPQAEQGGAAAGEAAETPPEA